MSYGIPEPPLDPPDDPPLVTCPRCEGDCVIETTDGEGNEITANCPRCHGAGEAYLTDEEIRDAAAEAAIDRAEARRDHGI